MIYFDNAATTYPKPPPVIAAMSRALVRYGANPGRAGHAMSLETADAVFAARNKCAELFGAEVENTVFMPNCTFALNTAIKGVLTVNSHAVMSDIEHNAVIRPLYALSKEKGVSYSAAVTADDDDATAESFLKLINRRTKAVICTVAGNVTGKLLPVEKIGRLCRERGICFIVDAAQGLVECRIDIHAFGALDAVRREGTSLFHEGAVVFRVGVLGDHDPLIGLPGTFVDGFG